MYHLVATRYAQREAVDPVLARRVNLYYTPYAFDGWTPHFTLLMPYTGNDPDALREALRNLLPPEPIQVKSICLLLMEDDETHYRLHKEYHLYT